VFEHDVAAGGGGGRGDDREPGQRVRHRQGDEGGSARQCIAGGADPAGGAAVPALQVGRHGAAGAGGLRALGGEPVAGVIEGAGAAGIGADPHQTGADHLEQRALREG